MITDETERLVKEDQPGKREGLSPLILGIVVALVPLVLLGAIAISSAQPDPVTVYACAFPLLGTTALCLILVRVRSPRYIAALTLSVVLFLGLICYLAAYTGYAITWADRIFGA